MFRVLLGHKPDHPALLWATWYDATGRRVMNVEAQQIGHKWTGVRPLRRTHAQRCQAPRVSLKMDEDSAFEEEFPVPKDQRPVNELKNLQQASMYSWVRNPENLRLISTSPCVTRTVTGFPRGSS